tara:strand:- start:6822 stop:7613 length:792 start_codon:yes stop_codon:yes gene_type:complete
VSDLPDSKNLDDSVMVEIRDLSKRYGKGPQILDSINLEVMHEEFISFLGPSGCGKSTLLKTLCGLINSSSGSVKIKGKSPDEARADCGFVFQDANLLPWLCVQQNAELSLKIRGVPKSLRREKSEALLKLVGLSESKEKFPRQLSGGMRMRVSIARALATSPSILLLDEPFASLDEMRRNRLNEDLLRIRNQDLFTAFYVTHSVGEALFLSSRVVILSSNPGRIHTIIDVPFEYPRTAALRESSAYLDLLVKTTHSLREVTVE